MHFKSQIFLECHCPSGRLAQDFQELPQPSSSKVSNLLAHYTTEEDEYTISAFGDIAASEINFIRCTSPDALELPRRNSSRSIKRPVPPSRRKAYASYSFSILLYSMAYHASNQGDLEDFSALCESLRVVRDQARVCSDHTKLKSQSFEEQVSCAMSDSQVPSYSGPIRRSRHTKPQSRQMNDLHSLTPHREYDLPGPLRHGAERLLQRPSFPTFDLYLEQEPPTGEILGVC
ncbi:hypothetical protein J3R30DRAFT_3702612 [Lentinula aciculospora]|uniref:Uncharacterized protein n=1 Tax=Lentinula aciculospora TaxID=153920 RepID=A0A9W9DPF2_9AGAR|nr:hypothetical protein J3R30DRAFT_3702612 [Lentinula aciculospora]